MLGPHRRIDGGQRVRAFAEIGRGLPWRSDYQDGDGCRVVGSVDLPTDAAGQRGGRANRGRADRTDLAELPRGSLSPSAHRVARVEMAWTVSRITPSPAVPSPSPHSDARRWSLPVFFPHEGISERRPTRREARPRVSVLIGFWRPAAMAATPAHRPDSPPVSAKRPSALNGRGPRRVRTQIRELRTKRAKNTGRDLPD
jgi:hypothetical protein